MNKIFITIILLLAFLLSGCSIDLDTSTSKSEGFSSAADSLGYSITEVKDKLKSLKNKESLTSQEQKQIADQIDRLTEEINQFKAEDAPILAKWTKKVAVKELDKKEEALKEIQEKAERENADMKDIDKILELLEDDIEVSLFGKK